MSGTSIVFDPLLPWPLILVAAGLAGVLMAFAVWRRLRGWALRALAAVAQADSAAAGQTAALGLARAHLQQALGLLP